MRTSFDTSIQVIQAAIEKTSVARLADVSGVAYTTIASFRSRGFANKGYETIARLSHAAHLILAEEAREAKAEATKAAWKANTAPAFSVDDPDTWEAP